MPCFAFVSANAEATDDIFYRRGYIPGISFVLNLKSGFAINAEGSATAIDSSVTIVNN